VRQDTRRDHAAYPQASIGALVANIPKTEGGDDAHCTSRLHDTLQYLAAFAVLCRPAYPAAEF